MNSKIPCEIIRDLIPLYAEGLVSEKTEECIKEHLSGCPSCRRAAGEAGKEIERPAVCTSGSGKTGEVDYLKKVRSTNRRKIILGVCITLCLVMLASGFKLFVYGSPDYGYTLSLSPSDTTGEYQLNGTFTGSAAVFSRYKVKATEDGGEEIIVYSCLTSPLNRTGSFSIDCHVNGSYLDINGTRIMADGTVYNAALAERLYDAAHPYVGDMPANNELALALDIAGHTGQYYNRLHTESEPYGWEFVFIEVKNTAKQEEISRKMKQCAPVLLALVENCDEIMWSFAEDSGNAPDEPSFTVSSDEASQLIGTDIKAFAESPEKVMELLAQLDL